MTSIETSRRRRQCLSRSSIHVAFMATISLSTVSHQVAAQSGTSVRAAQDLAALRDRGDLKLKLVSKANDDRIFFDAVPSDFTIRVTQKKVAAGNTIKGLLQDAGILPNADAYRVLYNLNPALRHVSKVAVGQEIILPVIETGQNVDRPAGSVVKLETFDASREALSQSTAGLSAPSEQTVTRVVAAITGGDRKAQLSAALSGYVAASQSIAKSAAGQNSLGFVRGLTEAINQLLDRFKDGPEPSAAEADQLLGMAEDINAIADCGRSNANCDLSIKVRTRNNAGDVLRLRIMYASAYRADQPTCTRQAHCVEEFRTGTSPALNELPPAKYTIWAMDAAGTVVSDRRDIVVKFGGINDFELAIR